MTMNEVCGDNRFEVIARAKEHIIESTNIETRKDEMKCLDNFLFRCWQMGWLKQYESASKIPNKCEKTQMVDKSTFSLEQYRTDLQSAYECGRTSVQPCEDAINRKDLDECIELMTDIKGDTVYAVRMSDIRQLPPVTPKQKMGRWILTDDDFVYCSECEDSYYPRPIDASWYYCPHCGAKMEEEENG